MVSLYEETTGGKSIDSALQRASNEYGVGFRGVYLVIREHGIHKLLNPEVQAIIDHVSAVVVLKPIRPCEVVCVVGEISKYRYLQYIFSSTHFICFHLKLLRRQ